ncbi:MAG: MlaD family protein [Candidatus Latescibacterota bacterium]|nr:MlaD family protein [Candidatus Latescibacterota bacterium]
MATRAQKARLALFLLVSTGILAAFLLVVVGSHLLNPRLTYYIEFEESVGGLTAGDPVKYQGITVGRVQGLSVSEHNLGIVRVEISLEAKKVPNVIREDTEARLYSQGVTGLKYIELIAGSQDAPVLELGETLPARATFLAGLEERADILTRKIEVLIENLSELTDDQNRRQLELMLSSGGNLLSSANDLLTHNRLSLDHTIQNLATITGNLVSITATVAATTDSLRHLIADDQTRGALADLRVATRAMREQMEGPIPDLLANLTRMTGNIDTTVTHIDRTVLQSRKNILDAMENLEETLLNVRQATELIREDPSILLRGRAEE